MTVKAGQGDIVWVSFPAQSGTEQAGRRPAPVVQEEGIASIPTVLVVPITSNGRALGAKGRSVPPLFGSRSFHALQIRIHGHCC